LEGGNADEVRFHKRIFDLKTEEVGLATLVVDDAAVKRIQVWVDFQHLCQSTPNLHNSDVGEIASVGLSTPNDCGSVPFNIVPGLLTAAPRVGRQKKMECNLCESKRRVYAAS
jgi:hypothetical protein